MKWPSSLTLIRHAESEYNALRGKKDSVPELKQFTKLFNKGYNAKDFEEQVFEGLWPSPELVALTKVVHTQLRAAFGSFSDIETPLTPAGQEQAAMTGKMLQQTYGKVVPDIAYVSPALRTHQTFDAIASEWSALKDVRVVEEERIREQEHGSQIIFNDWRIFSVLNPHAAVLRNKVGQYYFRYPMGESVCDVRERSRNFNAMLIREHSQEDVMAITHHLTILSTRANLERWDHKRFEEADEKEKPKNCGVTTYRGDPVQGKDGKLILEEYNRVHY